MEERESVEVTEFVEITARMARYLFPMRRDLYSWEASKKM
jgi:hypothetical protein